MGCFAFAWLVFLKHSKPLPDGESLFGTDSKYNLSRVSPCVAVTDRSLFTLTA